MPEREFKYFYLPCTIFLQNFLPSKFQRNSVKFHLVTFELSFWNMRLESALEMHFLRNCFFDFKLFYSFSDHQNSRVQPQLFHVHRASVRRLDRRFHRVLAGHIPTVVDLQGGIRGERKVHCGAKMSLIFSDDVSQLFFLIFINFP